MSSRSLTSPYSEYRAASLFGASRWKSKVSATGLTGKLALAFGLAVLAGSAAQAAVDVTFDMQAVASGYLPANQNAGASSSNVDIQNGGHSITVNTSAAGTRIVFDLFAVMNGSPTDYFNQTFGSVVSMSPAGELLAGAIVGANAPGMDATAQPGKQVGTNGVVANELSGVYDPNRGALVSGAYTNHGVADNISDVGELVVNRNSSASTFFLAGSKGITTGQQVGTQIPGSGKVVPANEVLLGEFVLTLTAGANGETTSIGYYLRPSSGTATNIQAYGLAGGSLLLDDYLGNGSAATGGGTGHFAFQNATLTVSTVPEPSAFGMVLLGAVSMVGFRRLGLRRRGV